MKATLATRIGLIALGEYELRCPKAPIDKNNTKRQGRHEKIFRGENNWDVIMDGPWLCDCCGGEFEVTTGTYYWDTTSGDLEPGNLYWDDSLPENYYWDNHKGPHLMAILPNSMPWNIDSRASNCTMKEDRTHRCWVRKGNPPDVHVDKDGHTCQAGAGSIWMNQGTPEEWHGYLHHGQFHT